MSIIPVCSLGLAVVLAEWLRSYSAYTTRIFKNHPVCYPKISVVRLAVIWSSGARPYPASTTPIPGAHP